MDSIPILLPEDEPGSGEGTEPGQGREPGEYEPAKPEPQSIGGLDLRVLRRELDSALSARA